MSPKNKLIRDVYYNMNKCKCENAEFIRAIRDNPAIYNPEHSDYKIVSVKEAIWKELANRFDVSCEVAKKRWKSLRDTYTKKFRISEEHAARFKYGKELQFLKPFMKSERLQNSLRRTNSSKYNYKPEYDAVSESDIPINYFQYDVMPDITEKNLFQVLDIGIFISHVKIHPILWDENYISNDIQEEQDQAWFSVAKNLIEDFEYIDSGTQNKVVKILKRKWKHLSERYLNSKKNSGARFESDFDEISSYTDLSFIEGGLKVKSEPISDYEEDYVEAQETESINEASHMNTEYLSDSLNEYENVTDDVIELSDEQFPEIKTEIENWKPLQISNDIVDEEDEDRLFLLSLVNEMKKIPKPYRLDARLNILVTLRNWQKIKFDSILDDLIEME